ncbi:hypothetical protein PoB_005440500 [Plakobranchus ocellatus]|uniref:Uncharacterized protein n=1 Tax=Plakobranchus ocellatus TaxID=259542 RepID=A0AAV4C930_9GAST|nr:hypothetical protein PoB_005440500 [Plakobranchus ocellatus]
MTLLWKTTHELKFEACSTHALSCAQSKTSVISCTELLGVQKGDTRVGASRVGRLSAGFILGINLGPQTSTGASRQQGAAEQRRSDQSLQNCQLSL